MPGQCYPTPPNGLLFVDECDKKFVRDEPRRSTTGLDLTIFNSQQLVRVRFPPEADPLVGLHVDGNGLNA